MNLDPDDKALARKRAREVAELDLAMFDIEAYIAANPTLVDGYPADTVADAFAVADAFDRGGRWDEVDDEEDE